MASLQITEEPSGSGAILYLSGRLVTEMLHEAERSFTNLSAKGGISRIDLSGIEAIDTAGAHLIATLQRRMAQQGATVEIFGASPAQAGLIKKVEATAFAQPPQIAPDPTLGDHISELGEKTVRAAASLKSLIGFLGLVVSRLLRTLVRPRRLRVKALFAQMQQTGYNAVPIVALMGFLIGIVLAYQGAAQLRQFGAEVFVVDLIAVSVLRELGILLTAIIVAGRSGSAYAAAIGSMKVNEEIDAISTLGLDPVEVLVLPRMIALILMLPVLGLVANISALFGGALMSWIELDVSPDMFVTRFKENTDVWHLIVGMIKAPFFAFIIALVSCWQGMQVEGSADSVGEKTRTSVVQSIFFVIVLDAVFSVFFVELGV
ncbi:MAG: ABC transporter permease [Pseudomonadota bacterium]